MRIYDIIKGAGLFFDRHVNKPLKLPSSFEDIKIPVNETVTTDAINVRLDKLYDNFIIIYF